MPSRSWSSSAWRTWDTWIDVVPAGTDTNFRPFGNWLSVPAEARGYRLEVNSQNRTATILYRNGKEVARAPQDSAFPIQFAGGHAPYSPRRNHITLIKHGAELRAIINGREVLRYTDPQPLDVGIAGIGGYKTRINFGHVEVRRIHDAP